MRKVSFPIHISFTIEEETNIINVAEAIRDLDIENLVLHNFIEVFNEIITIELCGEKYKHDKEEYEFERGGIGSRQITTMLGELKFRFDKIRDKKTGSIFGPVLDMLGIEPYKNYQDDIAFTCADIATKNSYRDTQYILKNFLKKLISPSTINRRLIEIGKEIKVFVQNKNRDNEDETYGFFYGDGTKSHSQEENRSKNDINVVMTTNDQGEKIFLGCVVNKPWKELNQEIDEQNVLDPDAVLISDADPELINALVNGDKKFQLDYIHIIRDIGYKLWSDGKLDLKTRKELVKKAEEIIYTLKNQTEKYAEDLKTLKIKINEVVDKLKQYSEDLYELGCNKTAKFVKKYSNYMVTFAILKTEGRDIPWNSNIIERLMGEIQKRCKHKWMRWTTEGQESILNLILTRYTNPKIYEEFKNQKQKTKNITNIQTKIKT